MNLTPVPSQPNKDSLRLQSILRSLFAAALILLSACSSLTVNETAYPYILNAEKLGKKPIKILVAPNNFGVPSKSYLQDYEAYIDDKVKQRLEDHGYTLIESTVYETAWRNAARKFGSPFDASESRINPNAFRRTVKYVLDEVKKLTDVDVVLYTDLLEQMVVFAGSNNRRAKWHGVSRKPRTGNKNQLSASFNWSQSVPAVSLRVIAYSVEGELIFKSFGGLEVSRQLDTTKESFVRRKDLFTSNKNVAQGVAIALHPLVPLKP